MPYKDKAVAKAKRAIYYQEYKIKHRDDIRIKRRLAYLKNKDKVKEQSDRYYREHRDAVLKRDKERHKNNRAHFNEYQRNKRNTDPNTRLRNNIQRRIISSLKVIGGIRKNRHTEELIGCSIDKLRQHLQQTAFRNGYFDFDANGYNGKLYHIDHIVPCAKFNLKCKYHQALCFHYSNLQILEAKENIRKSDKLAA